METRVYLYEGAQVTFRSENGLMVNANEMARIFGKKPNDYMRLDSTKEFFDAWQAENQTAGKPVVTKEGKNGGTWMHEDIALDFAQWLSPKFRVWCNARIKELMQHGLTATPAKLEEMLADPDTLITTLQALKSERAAKELAQEQLQLANATIQQQAPLVEYAGKVLNSSTLIKVDTIAQQLGVSAMKLNKMLAEAKIQYKQGSTWQLYADYRDKGLHGVKSIPYTDSSGEQKTATQLCWTEAGRKFILERFANR